MEERQKSEASTHAITTTEASPYWHGIDTMRCALHQQTDPVFEVHAIVCIVNRIDRAETVAIQSDCFASQDEMREPWDSLGGGHGSHDDVMQREVNRIGHKTQHKVAVVKLASETTAAIIA